MKNIIKLLIKVIDKGEVVKLLRNIIHPDGIKCPKCGNRMIKRKSKKHIFPRQYECNCGHYFSETDGTILRHCRINQIGIVKVFLFLMFLYLLLLSIYYGDLFFLNLILLLDYLYVQQLYRLHHIQSHPLN